MIDLGVGGGPCHISAMTKTFDVIVIGGDRLHELGQERQDVVVARLVPAGAARLDVLVLQRRLDEPDRGNARLVAGLHGRLQVIGESLAQHGWVSSQSGWSR